MSSARLCSHRHTLFISTLIIPSVFPNYKSKFMLRYNSSSKKSIRFLCMIPSRLIGILSIETTYLG